MLKPAGHLTESAARRLARDAARFAIIECFENYRSQAEADGQRASQKLFAQRYSKGLLPGLKEARKAIPDLDHRTLHYWLKQRANGWDGRSRYKGHPGSKFIELRPDIWEAGQQLAAQKPALTRQALRDALVKLFGAEAPSYSSVRRIWPRPSVAVPGRPARARKS